MAILDGLYVTDTDVTEHLTIELREGLLGTGAAADAHLKKHLDGAEGEVDSHLARRFTLPLQGDVDAFPILKTCALWFLTERLESINRRVHEDTVAMADKCREFLSTDPALGPNEVGETFAVPEPQVLMDFDDRVFTDGREEEDSNTLRRRVGFSADPKPFSRT